MKRTAALLWALALVFLAGCGSSRSDRTPVDLRGDAIRPVDKRPPEGTLSPPETQPEQFTLRRPAGSPLRRDTVVRVDPRPRAVAMPESIAISPARAATTTSEFSSPSASATTPVPAPTPARSQPKPAADPPPASGQFLQQEPPQVLSRVPAVAPPSAREARVGGTVLLKVLVGSDGLVRSTRIVRSISELDSAAIACVKQWKFKPAMSSGVAVAAWTDVPVRFLLQ